MENDTILRENLYSGYLETESVFAEMAPLGLSGEERFEMQIMQLQTDLRIVLEKAELIRLYRENPQPEQDFQACVRVGEKLNFRDKAYDLEFSGNLELYEFLADSGRIISQIRGDKLIYPDYTNLLCFFSSSDVVPLEWWVKAPSVLYLTNPYKGMNSVAKSELKKYLKINKYGCVLSISLTRFRSSIFVFPATAAKLSFWQRLSRARFDF